ncbi:MAG: hypothetical protein U0X20_08045 [Caldilineaceae bacterium]
MNPVTLIVGALVAGAVAATKDVTAQAIKDAYAGLKSLIIQKYAKASGAVQQLEEKPESEGRQAVAKEELVEAGAGMDEAIVTQAKALLDLLKEAGQLDRASYNANVSGSGAIAQGPGAVAAGQGGIAVGGDVQGGISVGSTAKPNEPKPES